MKKKLKRTIMEREKDMSYCKLKTQMRQLIRMAKEVIEEVEKDQPDDILISDIVTEEAMELLEQASSTIFRFNGSTSV